MVNIKILYYVCQLHPNNDLKWLKIKSTFIVLSCEETSQVEMT